MSQKIINHFKEVDPILYQVISILDTFPEVKAQPKEKYFYNLVDSIISQQLSGKAASTIFNRVQALLPARQVTPRNILELDTETIRTAGVSYGKISYLKDLAQRVQSKQIILDSLLLLSDEEVIKELVLVKGIGHWTAEMFLMFTLGREDIFSLGDLGLKNAMILLYRLESPTKQQLEELSKIWSPYRTYASKILWKSLEIKT